MQLFSTRSINSYGIVLSDRKPSGKSTHSPVLTKIKWHRVILDECHNIKKRAAGQSKAIIDLQSDRFVDSLTLAFLC